VQLAGPPSWRFEQSGGQLLSRALAVRDACGLPVPGGPAVPPPLVDVPPPAGDLTPGQRDEAARQWAVWWADLVELEARRLAPERSAPPGAPTWLAGLTAAGTPPDFAGLADRPELRRAARATAEVWHPSVERARGAFAAELVRQVAEDVAFDRSVPIDRVAGAAVVLDVRGGWWHEVGTGTVLCSRATAQEPRVAHQVLRRAFESGLRRP